MKPKTKIIEVNNKKYKLSEALSIADISYDDGAHDALVDAKNTARLFAKTQGVLSGVSAGAALFAAGQLAQQPAYQGKTVVVLLPDRGERYLSTDLFQDLQ